MRRKHIIRITIIFFVCLIVLTFCSRTIYRRMLPNVEVASATSGMLRYTYTSNDIRISGERTSSVQILVLLSRALTINKIYIRVNEYVKEGDALIGFHAQDGNYLLDEAVNKLEQSQISLKLWQNDYINKLADLNAIIKKTRKGAEKERLERELELLNAGIMNSTSESILEAEVEQWRSMTTILQGLKSDRWIFKAPYNGYVEQVLVGEGDGYLGLAPILMLCPENSSYLIGCVWKDAPISNVDEWIVHGSIPRDSELKAVDTDVSGNETTIWFAPTDDTPPPDQISGMYVTADSPYYTALVPNKALEGGKLYLLKSKTGAWKQTEYYVKEVTVVTGSKDEKNTVILSGLQNNDALVISWNKPIRDGDAVLLTSYE